MTKRAVHVLFARQINVACMQLTNAGEVNSFILHVLVGRGHLKLMFSHSTTSVRP